MSIATCLQKLPHFSAKEQAAAQSGGITYIKAQMDAAIRERNRLRQQAAGNQVFAGGRWQDAEAFFASMSDAERASFRATERAYGGKEAHERAKKAGKTKLNYRQWVQVRTPEFKAWFGDWEAARDLHLAVETLTRQEAESALAKLAGRDLPNLETGIVAQVNSTQAGKLVSQAAISKSEQNGFSKEQHLAVAANIENLWKHAIPFEERGDQNGDPNIKAIKRFAAPFMMGGNPGYAMLTVKESTKDGHRVYSVEVQELKTLRSTLDKSTNQSDSQLAPVRSVESIIDRLNAKINPAEVSKVTDPETGEPMVVYHGTHGDFNTFRINPDIGAAFISTSRKEAEAFTGASGSNVMPLFANIRSLPDTIYNSADEVSAIRRARKNGKDGIRVQDRGGLTPDGNGAVNYAVFSPNPIKSATGNTGAFSNENDDIRFSIAAANPATTSAATQQSSNWSVAPPKTKLAQMMDEVIYQFQDKYKDLNAIIKAITDFGGAVRDAFNPYIAETLMHGRVAEFSKQFMEREIKPILSELEKAGITMTQFENFLHARHAVERNKAMRDRNPTQAEIDAKMSQLAIHIRQLQAQGFNADSIIAERNALKNAKPWTGTLEDRNKLSGMSDKDAGLILGTLQQTRHWQLLNDLGNRVDAITARTRADMLAYGLETPETVDAMDKAYKHYVPLMRDMEESDLLSGGGNGSGSGVGNVRGSRVRTATGSTKAVENIFANLVAQREAVIARGEKNRVGQSLWGLVGDNQNAGFWAQLSPKMTTGQMRAALTATGADPAEIDAIVNSMTVTTTDPITGIVRTRMNPLLPKMPNVVSLRINGEDRFIVFSRKNDVAVRLAQTMSGDEQAWIQSGPAMNAIGHITRWLASINTQYNPVFGLTNFTRDVQEAALNLASTPLAGHQKAVMKGIPAAMKTIWDTVRGKNPQGQMAQYYREYLESGAATGYRDSYSSIEERAKAIEKEMYGKGLRNAKGVKQVFDLLSDYNESVENATRLAVYVEARKNGLSTVKAAELAKGITVNFNRRGASSGAMSNLFAFFNAAAQGTERMARTLMSPAGRKIIYGGIGLGMLQVVFAAAAMGDDDWDDIPEFEKAKNLILPIPSGDKKYIKIPMPLGFNILPNIGRSLAEMAYYNDRMAERAGNLILAVADSLNPLGGSTLLGTVTPSAFDPAVELASNKDAFGKSIYREDISGLDPVPGHSRARESTSWPWVELSKAINYITGGDEDKPGMASPPPEALSYLFGVALGGVARETDKLGGFAGSLIDGSETPPYRIPVFSRFYGEAGGDAATRSKYYDAIKEINMAENQVKGRHKRGEDVPDSLYDIAGLASTSRKLQKNISDLNKQRFNTSDREERRWLDAEVLERQKRLLEIYQDVMTW
jgi:hypothetical protein